MVTPVEPYPMIFEPQMDSIISSAKSPDELNEINAWIANNFASKPLYHYRPLPMARKFHESQKRMRWNLGGNRSSKSHAIAHEALFFALGIHPFRKIETPNIGLYSTVQWDMVGSILWQEKLKPMLAGIPHRVIWHNRGRDIPTQIIIPVEGGESKIVFGAYEQGRESFQGRHYRWIAVDEQMPQDVFTEMISRVGGGAKLDFFAGMTPIEPQPWLEDKLTNPPKDYGIFEFPLDDNRVSRGGFIDDGVIDSMIAEWPPEVIATRRNGKWGSFVGSVFTTFNRQTHVIAKGDERKMFPRGKPDEYMYQAASIDWGAVNAFVYLIAAKLDHLDGAWYIFDEYYHDGRTKGMRLIKDHATEIKDMIARWSAAPRRTWSDHDRQDRYEIEQYGIKTDGAKKELQPGIETVQRLLKPNAATGKPKLYIAERCVNLIRQISTLKWRDGSKNADGKDEPIKKDDHCLIAGTMVTTIAGEVPIENIKVGDMVLTRSGYNRVTFSGITGRMSPTITMHMSNGRELTGTLDHRVWVFGKGYIELRDLRYGDTLVACPKTPMKSFPMESLSEDIQTRKTAFAAAVENLSLSINTQENEVARVHVLGLSAGKPADVYDLTVENAHQFFANGILVSNSTDAMRYIVHSESISENVPRGVMLPASNRRAF